MGIKILDDYAYKSLRTSNPGSKVIEGVHSYDMLANPKYAMLFQYTHISQRDSEEEIDQCDKCRIVLALAYMSEEKAEQLSIKGTGLQAIMQKNLADLKNMQNVRKKRKFSKTALGGAFKGLGGGAGLN